MKKNVGTSVAILVERDNKILFGQRHPEIIGGGFWCLPMGKLEWGETLEDCARRELREEAGLNILKLEPLTISNVILANSHFITVGFIATNWEGEPTINAPDEIVRWDWFDYGNLPSPIFRPSGEITEVYKRYSSFSWGHMIEIKDI